MTRLCGSTSRSTTCRCAARMMRGGVSDANGYLSNGVNVMTAHDNREEVGLRRFRHHPDPAIDYCVEVEEIESILFDIEKGILPLSEFDGLTDRVCFALQFQVGGDQNAVGARRLLLGYADRLKALVAATKPPTSDTLASGRRSTRYEQSSLTFPPVSERERVFEETLRRIATSFPFQSISEREWRISVVQLARDALDHAAALPDGRGGR